MKIAFLDRDGTIVRDYPDDAWRDVCEPEFLDGSIHGIRELIGRGYKVIIITNQYIIAEGIITVEQYESFTRKMLKEFRNNGVEILDIFYCPHSRDAGCRCCKPQIGLIEQALKKYPEIDMENSFMCGDSESDMQCAQNAGLKFYGIGLGQDCIKDLSDLCTAKLN